MQSLALVSRINILTALRDHDLQGPTEFGETLGFESPSEEILVERGRKYDARAVLAYAHGKATGSYLGPDDITLGSLDILTEHGFRVTTLSEISQAKKAGPAPRARTPRAAAAPKTTRSKPEPVVKFCPTCFTQLSVAGTCDYCD